MNILIAAKYSPPISGNFIASLRELGLKLQADGHGVFFIFPEAAKTRCKWVDWLEESGFTVAFLDDSKDSNSIVAAFQKYIGQWKIDLIHCHFGFCLKDLAINRHKLLGAKLLVHDHMDYSPDSNLPAQHIKQWLLSAIYRLQGIGVVAVMKKKKLGYWLSNQKRVWFVPNGLSLQRYVQKSISREEMRKHLNIPDDAHAIMLLGWRLNLKGVDIAIKAVNELRQTNPNAILMFPGLGESPDPSKCEWIKQRTGIDPLETPWLRFLPSFEDMFACHRAADTYLSASRKEAFSYGLLESISQNVPVVISDIEGTSWAKEYNKCFSYPVEDASACAKALALAIPKRCDKSNYNEIVDQYNIDSWCRSIIDIYNQMLK